MKGNQNAMKNKKAKTPAAITPPVETSLDRARLMRLFDWVLYYEGVSPKSYKGLADEARRLKDLLKSDTALDSMDAKTEAPQIQKD